MSNPLRKIPIYLAALSTFLLPINILNLNAQEKTPKSNLITIAERQEGDKTIEYKSDPDTALHMQVLGGVSSTLILSYDRAKSLLNSELFPEGPKKELIEACGKIDTNITNGIITEKELMPELIFHFPEGKCLHNRNLGSGLVKIVSLDDKTFKGTPAINEHLWALAIQNMQNRGDSEIGGLDSPFLGFNAIMYSFSAEADKDGDHIISPNEYLEQRKKILKNVSLSEFSSTIGKGWSRVSSEWKNALSKGWSDLAGGYLIKSIMELYKDQDKFVQNHLTKEEREELKEFKLNDSDNDMRQAYRAIMPWVNLTSPSKPDRVALYIAEKLIDKSDLEELSKGLSRFKSNGLFEKDSYVERRVIREPPVLEKGILPR